MVSGPLYVSEVIKQLVPPMAMLLFSMCAIYAGVLAPYYMEAYIITGIGWLFLILSLLYLMVTMYTIAIKGGKIR